MSILVEKLDSVSFAFRVERLWEHEDGDWAFAFRKAGLPVRSVRKGISEGRGCLIVEFHHSVDESSVVDVIESKTPVSPRVEHFYRLTDVLTIQPAGNSYSFSPVDLESGTILRLDSILPGGDLFFRVVTGDHNTFSFAMTASEWVKAATLMVDTGRYIAGQVLDGTDEKPKKSSGGMSFDPDDYMRVSKSFPTLPISKGPLRFLSNKAMKGSK